MSARRNSYSVSLAAGNPTSISLKPSLTRNGKIQLFLQAHGYDKALVAVAQIHAAPDGRFFNVVFFCPAHFAPGGGKISGFVLVCMHHGSILLFLFGFGGWPWERKSSVSWPFGPRDGALKSASRYHSCCRETPGRFVPSACKTGEQPDMITVSNPAAPTLRMHFSLLLGGQYASRPALFSPANSSLRLGTVCGFPVVAFFILLLF